MTMRNPYKIPPAAKAMKIGLFGGSFNPPHKGHLNVSKIALRQLELNQVWWIITPGNPLKDHSRLKSLKERIADCQILATHPSIKVTAFEDRYNIRYTADTLRLLHQRRPLANFTWIMGADNFASFHKWDRWREIADNIPLTIIDRPGSTVSPNSTPATYSLAKYRLDERDGGLIAAAPAPSWTFIHAKRSFLSSTQIRNKRH